MKTSPYLRIRDLGGNRIGCTSILVELCENYEILYRMLLDAGLSSYYDYEEGKCYLNTQNLQKIKELLNEKISNYENGIQSIIVTHVHEDHAGALPWIHSYCKRNKIREPLYFMTPLSALQFDIFQQQLYDIFNEAAKNSGYEWTWEKGEAKQIPIKPQSYYTIARLDNTPEDYIISFRFIPSGHIVGSAMIEIFFSYRKEDLGSILYTGDFCLREGSFLVDPPKLQELREIPYNAVIFENTYLFGRRNVKERRKIIKEELVKFISPYLKAGAKVVLLVYGVDRTANVLVCLREIMEDKELGKKLPTENIYLDTRLGKSTSDIYDENLEKFVKFLETGIASECFREELVNRYNQQNLKMYQKNDKQDIFEPIFPSMRKEYIERDEPCILVATSATLMGGTVFTGYLQTWRKEEENLFLIMGSAIPNTPAWHALRGRPLTVEKFEEEGKEKIYFNKPGFAELKEFNIISAHANYEELKHFVNSINARIYIATHIGGSQRYSYDTIQNYLEELVFGFKYKKGKKAFITDSENAIIIKLKPHYRSILIGSEQWNKLIEVGRKMGYKGKFGYNEIKKIIERLINEYYAKLKEQTKNRGSL